MRGNHFLPVTFELTGTLVSFSCLWTHTATVPLPESGACLPLNKDLTISSSGTQFLSSDTSTPLGASLQTLCLLCSVGFPPSVSSDKTLYLQATWSQVEICTPPGLDCAASPYPKQMLESSSCAHTRPAGSFMNIITLSRAYN